MFIRKLFKRNHREPPSSATHDYHEQLLAIFYDLELEPDSLYAQSLSIQAAFFDDAVREGVRESIASSANSFADSLARYEQDMRVLSAINNLVKFNQLKEQLHLLADSMRALSNKPKKKS